MLFVAVLALSGVVRLILPSNTVEIDEISLNRKITTINTLTWNLEAICVQGAWMLTNGSRNITVAVLDSGINFTQTFLQGAYWNNTEEVANNGIDDDGNGFIDDITGWDFVQGDNNPSPGHWHGTYVANFIHAVAPNATLMNLRILDDNNAFSGSFWPQIVQAVNYAVDMGADIIQISIWNYGVSPSSFQTALQNALTENVTIVGITGNTWDDSSTSGVLYPGKFPEVIATSAIGSNLQQTYFSREGPENELCAPGANLPVYESLIGKGTSFAAPHVSGCIALMKSINQSLTPPDIRQILQTTAIDLGDPGKDNQYGYGLVNVSNAVRVAAGEDPWYSSQGTSSAPTTPTSFSDTTTNESIPTSSSSKPNTTPFMGYLEIFFLTNVVYFIRRRKKNP
jgi:subtilisin family serine protease